MSFQINTEVVTVDIKVENDRVEMSIEDKKDPQSTWLKLTCCLRKKVVEPTSLNPPGK